MNRAHPLFAGFNTPGGFSPGNPSIVGRGVWVNGGYDGANGTSDGSIGRPYTSIQAGYDAAQVFGPSTGVAPLYVQGGIYDEDVTLEDKPMIMVCMGQVSIGTVATPRNLTVRQNAAPFMLALIALFERPLTPGVAIDLSGNLVLDGPVATQMEVQLNSVGVHGNVDATSILGGGARLSAASCAFGGTFSGPVGVENAVACEWDGAGVPVTIAQLDRADGCLFVDGLNLLTSQDPSAPTGLGPQGFYGCTVEVELDSTGGPIEIIADRLTVESTLQSGAAINNSGDLEIDVVDLGATRMIDGFRLSFSSVTAVSIDEGECIDDLNLWRIGLSSPIVADLALSGAGGLDTGVVATGSTYALYVIDDPTGGLPISGLWSLDLGSPAVIPAGYGSFRRVGVFKTRPDVAQILPFTMSGSGKARTIWFEASRGTSSATGGTQVLASGTSDAFVAIPNLSDLQPDDTDVLHMEWSASADNFDGRPGAQSSGVQRRVKGGETSVLELSSPIGSPYEYRRQNAGFGDLDIAVVGYQMEV